MVFRNSLLGLLGIVAVACSGSQVTNYCQDSFNPKQCRESIQNENALYTSEGEFLIPIREQSKVVYFFGDEYLAWDIKGSGKRKMCVAIGGDYTNPNVGEADVNSSLRRYIRAVSPGSDAESFLSNTIRYVSVSDNGMVARACVDLDRSISPRIVSDIERDLMDY